jgi:hypothetical protein
MAQVLGAHSLVDLAFPASIDAGLLKQYERETGVSAEAVISAAATLVGDVNTKIMSTSGGLLYITEEDQAMYEQGAGERTETPREVEYSRSDAVRGGEQGHMFPRYDYEDYIEMTNMFKRRGNLEQLRRSLNRVAERWQNRVDREIWTRALTNTENVVGAGYDAGWAIGTGTNANLIPPQYMGNAFDSTHTHYVWSASGSTTLIEHVNAGMLQLRHHGISGTLALYVSQTDVPTYLASAAVRKLEPTRFVFVGGNSGSPVGYAQGEIQGVPGELIGYFDGDWGTAEIRYHPRIPTEYAFLTKSYGVNHPENGIHVRVDPIGFGLRVDPQLSKSLTPKIEALKFEATHGVSVGSRLNGVALYRHTGISSYANPTIS